MIREYAVIYEPGSEGEENWGAYVPDLPGCITTGATLEEARQYIRAAIEIHLQGLRDGGLPVPEPSTRVEQVGVTALAS